MTKCRQMVKLSLLLNLGRKVELTMDISNIAAMNFMTQLKRAMEEKDNTQITVIDSVEDKAIVVKPKSVLFGYIDPGDTVRIEDVKAKKSSCQCKEKENEPKVCKSETIPSSSITHEVAKEEKTDTKHQEDHNHATKETRMHYEKGTPEWYQNTHRVMMDCKACGQTSFARLYKNSEQAKCKWCGETVDISDLRQARARCKKCGYEYGVHVPVDCKEVECMNCHAPIDLKFHEKKNVLVTVR